jgi:iron complex outermembrane receptor protein
LTVGLRYTEETKDIIVDAFGSAPAADENGLLPSFGLTEIAFPTVVGTRYVNQDLHSLDVDDTSGHLNLQYKLDSATLYASYSEAFKSGGWNPLYNAVQPANGLNIGDVQTGPGDPTAFNPEFAETLEVGFKWDPTDNFRLNGALFSTDYKDLQLTNRVGIVPLLFNAGEAGIDGMELEFTFTPSSKWIVEGSLGYLDGSIDSPVPIVTREVVDGVITEVVATQTVSAGNDTPYSPDLMANVGVSYIVNLDGWSLTPRLDINYVDSQFFDAGNTVEIAQVDEQTTARFALTLDSDNNNWRAVAGIENLTDETYPVAGNSSLATATGYAEVVYNRPRVYYFNVEYSF